MAIAGAPLPLVGADPVSACSDAVIADARARGLSARLMRVLSRRGPVDSGGARGPLRRAGVGAQRSRGSCRTPTAPWPACRLRSGAGERVLVLGDFDADGLTGLAILVLALRHLGLDVEPYVPARTEEGHGLSQGAVERALAGGRTLILTADTGSTSHVEIAAARRGRHLGHRHGPSPAARWPAGRGGRRQPPSCRQPLSRHAAVGRRVSRSRSPSCCWRTRRMVRRSRSASRTSRPSAPSRTWCRSRARTGPSPASGCGCWRRVAGRDSPRCSCRRACHPTGSAPRPISFALAPRINALGRVGHALDAALLLLEDDPERIAELVARMEAANLERRGLMTAALAEAREALGPDDGCAHHHRGRALGAGCRGARGRAPGGPAGSPGGRVLDHRRPLAGLRPERRWLRPGCRVHGQRRAVRAPRRSCGRRRLSSRPSPI